jgi:hypothetical protein
MIQFFVGFWIGFTVGLFVPIIVFYLLARRPTLLLKLFLKIANIPPDILTFLAGLSVLQEEKDKKKQESVFDGLQETES